MESEILSSSIESAELNSMIDRELDMGFFEKYLDSEGNLQGCGKDGCTRINYCSCDCNHNTCAFLVL